MVDIICYWHSDSRTWIVYCLDYEGNQLWDAQFYPNKERLADDWCK